MHLYYTELVYIYVYTVHIHTHVFATHMAPGVATFFFFLFSPQKQIDCAFQVISARFANNLQVIAVDFVITTKIISFTSVVASHLTNQVAALGTPTL